MLIGKKPAGLRNLGATCYVNSFLQTLSYSPAFIRELIPRAAVVPQQDSAQSIAFQLMKLITLQQSGQFGCLDPHALVSSFNWSQKEMWMQQDLNQFSKVFFQALEEGLLSVGQSGLVHSIFVGKLASVIECLSCSYKSQREEQFIDLTLLIEEVANQVYNSTLKQALQQLLKPELLDGDNMYRCQICCKPVPAKKYITLKKLPPILNLTLARFSYNFETGRKVKVTSKFSFPLVLDMDQYMGGYQLIPDKEAVLKLQRPVVARKLQQPKKQPKQVKATAKVTKKTALRSEQTKKYIQQMRARVKQQTKPQNKQAKQQANLQAKPQVDNQSQSAAPQTLLPQKMQMLPPPPPHLLEQLINSTQKLEQKQDGQPEKQFEEQLKQRVKQRQVKTSQQQKEKQRSRQSQLREQQRVLLQKHVGQNTYRLYSIIIHRGKVDFGHYKAFVRIGQTWWEFNDHDTRQCSLAKVLDSSCGDKDADCACSLFYVRQPQDQTPVHFPLSEQFVAAQTKARLQRKQNVTFGPLLKMYCKTEQEKLSIQLQKPLASLKQLAKKKFRLQCKASALQISEFDPTTQQMGQILTEDSKRLVDLGVSYDKCYLLFQTESVLIQIKRLDSQAESTLYSYLTLQKQLGPGLLFWRKFGKEIMQAKPSSTPIENGMRQLDSLYVQPFSESPQWPARFALLAAEKKLQYCYKDQRGQVIVLQAAQIGEVKRKICQQLKVQPNSVFMRADHAQGQQITDLLKVVKSLRGTLHLEDGQPCPATSFRVSVFDIGEEQTLTKKGYLLMPRQVSFSQFRERVLTAAGKEGTLLRLRQVFHNSLAKRILKDMSFVPQLKGDFGVAVEVVAKEELACPSAQQFILEVRACFGEDIVTPPFQLKLSKNQSVEEMTAAVTKLLEKQLELKGQICLARYNGKGEMNYSLKFKATGSAEVGHMLQSASKSDLVCLLAATREVVQSLSHRPLKRAREEGTSARPKEKEQGVRIRKAQEARP